MKATRKKTVLIVDDSPGLRKYLCELFTSSGFEVCAEAGSAAEAVEKTRICNPELIILDHSMPVTSGIQIAPELKKIAPQTPIILFSIYADAFYGNDLAMVGITAAVSKSDPTALLEKAESLF